MCNRPHTGGLRTVQVSCELFSPRGRCRNNSAATQAHSGVKVPQDEKLRRMKAFDETRGDDGPYGELDVIVFTKNNLRPYAHPERAGNVLVCSNRTFEVWLPAEAGP
jgi:hypothetical protein